MNNSYITIIKEKRTALSRKRVPLNQNECTDDFRIDVPFEQNLHLQETEVVDVQWVNPDKLFEMFRLKHLHPLITYVDQLIG